MNDLCGRSTPIEQHNDQDNINCDTDTERCDEEIYSMKKHQSQICRNKNHQLTEETGSDSDSDNDLGRFYTVENNIHSSTSMGYISSKNYM